MNGEFKLKSSYTSGKIKSVTNSNFSSAKVEKKAFKFVPQNIYFATPDNEKITINNRRKYKY